MYQHFMMMENFGSHLDELPRSTQISQQNCLPSSQTPPMRLFWRTFRGKQTSIDFSVDHRLHRESPCLRSFPKPNNPAAYTDPRDQ
jgi:hypothetical protein